jgi:hypothetical protein
MSSVVFYNAGVGIGQSHNFSVSSEIRLSVKNLLLSLYNTGKFFFPGEWFLFRHDHAISKSDIKFVIV